MTALETRLSEGLALHQQGRLDDAARIYQAVLRQQPDHFDALHLLGMAALQSRRTELGVRLIQKAVTLNGTIAAVHVTLGNGLRDLARPEEALGSYDTAISLDPGHAQAWQNRGNALVELRRTEEAIASYDKAITLLPEFAEAYCGRGNALWELHRPEEAVACFDQAIGLRPDLAVAHHNRGNVLPYLNRLDEALASQEQAIALQPHLAEAHSGRGNALWELRRPEAALASYDRAVALKPGYADAYWNASLCLLQLGHYEQGWRLFEWRKRLPEPMGSRAFSQPLWLGEQDIAGKTLFIYWEQGLGDTIQFCRYVKLAEARGARVILDVQAPLLGLLRQISPTIQVVTAPQVPATFDYHCPLMSLPLAFGTTVETIPVEERYLWAEEEVRARWSARLGPAAKRRVGLVWAGGANYKGNHKRSMDLAACLPLFDLDVDWICLQKDVGENDTATLRGTDRLAFFGDELNDFSDTAALIELIDLVVTVDTSVAHLAAAMGKPVWILLPYSSDWRWLRDREDSPWYPTATVFRQQRPGDWASVVDQVARALRSWAADALPRTIGDQAETWYKHGNALLGQKRPEEAIASYDMAISLDPGNPDAYTNRGNALLQLKRYAEAITSFDAAVSVKPDYTLAIHNRGNALLELRRPVEAIASYDQAIRLDPNTAETHAARGNALWELKCPEEALASFRKAIALKPRDADAYWNASLCLLQMGDFEQGWRLFEWRKRLDRHTVARSYPRPLWLGEQDIAGKTLFIYWEQGLGDTIQFCRYAKLAEARGAKIIMEVQPTLRPLLKQISASIQVIVSGEQCPEFDFHCPLLSLPLAFGTTPETVPSERRYLWAEEEQRMWWSMKLGPKTRPRIGVVWAGSPGHRYDHNRSIGLAACLPLFDLDADWICLQKELRDDDLALARQIGGPAFFGGDIDDFGDTAALVELMDLIITVDTSVAHLAAAMGKPVWILLPYSPDWRWLLDRDDSPWYPTVKLFRQRQFRDWAGVIDQVALALRGGVQ